jgi:hypothetical protein
VARLIVCASRIRPHSPLSFLFRLHTRTQIKTSLRYSYFPFISRTIQTKISKGLSSLQDQHVSTSSPESDVHGPRYRMRTRACSRKGCSSLHVCSRKVWQAVFRVVLEHAREERGSYVPEVGLRTSRSLWKVLP